MLIYPNAEEVHGQRKFGNPCSSDSGIRIMAQNPILDKNEKKQKKHESPINGLFGER